MLLAAGGETMKKVKESTSKASQDSEIIKIKVKPDLLRLINSWKDKVESDESTIIQYCIETGIFLGEMDSQINQKMVEDLAVSERLQEVRRQNIELLDTAQVHMKKIKDLAVEKSLGIHDVLSDKVFEPAKDLWIRIDDDTYNQLKNYAKEMGVDNSTFVNFCIRTGLYLGELNLYLQMKSRENK